MHDTPGSATGSHAKSLLALSDTFLRRHLGSNPEEIAEMLATLGHSSLESLVDAAIPRKIRLERPLRLPPEQGEHETLLELRALAEKNKVCKSYLGQGYSGCITPPVIQRNILENPGW